MSYRQEPRAGFGFDMEMIGSKEYSGSWLYHDGETGEELSTPRHTRQLAEADLDEGLKAASGTRTLHILLKSCQPFVRCLFAGPFTEM